MGLYVGISQTVDPLMGIALPGPSADYYDKDPITTMHCPCDDVVIAATVARFKTAGSTVKAEAHLDLASLPHDKMLGLLPSTPTRDANDAAKAGALLFVKHTVSR